MKIALSGFDRGVSVDAGFVSVLEVHDRRLFARVCQSLFLELGERAPEPYYLWDGEDRKNPRNAFLFVFNPFDLPWGDRTLLGDVLDRVEGMILDDDEKRREIEFAARALSDRVAASALCLQSDYSFGVEWDARKYLKAFDFGVEVDGAEPLLDNLIKFLKFASDASFDRMLVFVNLKNFLSGSELEEFYREAIFSELQVLLLEERPDGRRFEQERKIIIDEELLQE